MAADADSIVTSMGLRPDWPNVGAISLAHSYGFSNLVLPLLLHGIPLWISGGPLPELLRRAAGELPAVTLAAVPALWKMWHQAHAIPSNVRLAISAGAPLPLALENDVYNQQSLKIHNFYGSSECGGIAYDSTTVPRTCAAVAGTPLRHVRVGISDNGCVEVHGPAVASCYWPHPDPALRAGTFRTADLGEIKDGIIHLLGRATDQINVAGRKVAPELIERTLTTHPDVKDCLVFGVPAGDHHRGEKIVAYVCLASTGTLDAVKGHVLAHLPAWQVPREWRVIDSLQVNGRGKRSRAEWKKNYAELFA